MDNPEKLATYRHKTKTNKTKTQRNMCWTNKHKQTQNNVNVVLYWEECY